MGPELATRFPAARRRGDRLLAFLSVAFAVFVAGFALHVVLQSVDERFTNLFLDQWKSLADRASHPFLRWLFLHHNGHLIPATRLLLHWDYEHLGGRGDLPLLISFLCTGVTIVLLSGVLRMSRTSDVPLRTTLGAFFAFCLLWSGLFYGYLWSFSVHAPMTLMWIVMSLACLVALALRVAERAPWSAGLAALALVSAFAASLSQATGVGAWVGLLAIAVTTRLPRGLILAIVVGGCLSGMLLAVGASGSGTSVDVVEISLRHPGKLSVFLLSFIGLPIALAAQSFLTSDPSVTTSISLCAGGVGILVLVAHGIRSVRQPSARDALGLLGLGLMVYGVAAATLTGLGRSLFADAIALRFTPFATLFWMGGTSAVASAVCASRRFAAFRVGLAVLLPAASIAMLPALDARIEIHRKLEAWNSRSLLKVLVGIRDEDVLEALSWNAERASSILPMLERDRRGPWAEPGSDFLGRPLSEVYAGAAYVPCPGSITKWQRIRWRKIDGEGASGTQISGILAVQQSSAPTSILVVDAGETIRGLGTLQPASEPHRTPWVAFLSEHAPSRLYHVYARLEDRSVCRFDR